MKRRPFRSLIGRERSRLHAELLQGPLKVNDSGTPANADTSSKTSVEFAVGMVDRIGGAQRGKRLMPQKSGKEFELIVKNFVERTFLLLSHLRPGRWRIYRGGRIDEYEQYRHLHLLDDVTKETPVLSAIVGSGYLIKPDIVIARERESDAAINNPNQLIVDKQSSLFASLRRSNGPTPSIHACISCKWTLRSDRAQNARSEGLTLVRYRKGKLPHVVVVTGEPMPGRLASLALGTGEIDHVYHIALHELRKTIESSNHDDSKDLLKTMIEGNRLRDISDLPLDLVV